MPLNILIVGCGVGGPALALFLQQTNLNPNVTVIERYPSLRAAGQQIDVKGEGVQVCRKAGLLETVRARCVDEKGLEVVDSSGKAIASFGVSAADGSNRFGGGMTQEYEIMRGDLVNVLYEASLERRAKLEGKEGGLMYEFGKTVTELVQSYDGVEAVFSDGQRRKYDLIVAADGQGSRTRRLAFGQEASDEAFTPFGVHGAGYSIPKLKGESDLAKFYNIPGRRGMMIRTSGRPETQVYLFTASDTERLRKMNKEPIEKRKEVWAETFAGAGWKSDQLMDGLKTCDDFYVAEGGQVKMKQLFTGRVVLLGESGYGGTFTGVGTELALTGAYILAGELARNGSDLTGALKAYENKMRTPIDEWQATPFTERTVLRIFLPSSSLAIWLVRTIMWAACLLRLGTIANWLMPASKPGWQIPEYPELELPSCFGATSTKPTS